MSKIPVTNIRGSKGDTGDQGVQGIQGPQGERGLPGANAVPADEAVAAYIAAPDSETNAELRAAIVDVGRPSFSGTPASRENVVIDTVGTFNLNEFPGFYVYGINIGIRNTDGTPAYRTMWTTQWSNEWIDEQVKRIADLGANTIRIMGSYGAYVDGPTVYKERFEYAIEAVRHTGMKVIFVLLTASSPNEPVGVSHIPGYTAMVDDLLVKYVGDPLILAWDVANEFAPATSESVAIITAMSTAVHDLDPSAKVTAAIYDYANPTGFKAVDDFVDFHSVNFYPGATGIAMPNRHFSDRLRWGITSKPILVSEVGMNYSPDNTGNLPRVSDRIAQARFLDVFRKYTTGDLMGVVVHKIIDSNTPNKFGLYDDSGEPTPSLSAYAKYPTTRLAVIEDALRYRYSPVVLDNFARAASATVVGTPPIGSAPTQQRGTWGITAARHLYVATTSGSGVDSITWEANTADCILEMEATPNDANNQAFGLILRWLDASNYMYFKYRHTNTGAATIDLFKVVGGVATNITPASEYGGVGGAPQTVHPLPNGVSGSLKAHLWGPYVGLYMDEIFLGYVAGPTELEKGTKHGIGVTPGQDLNTRFYRFRASVDGRTY